VPVAVSLPSTEPPISFLAEVLRASVRPDDAICRLGGGGSFSIAQRENVAIPKPFMKSRIIRSAASNSATLTGW